MSRTPLILIALIAGEVLQAAQGLSQIETNTTNGLMTILSCVLHIAAIYWIWRTVADHSGQQETSSGD